jgi:hypothetical protein
MLLRNEESQLSIYRLYIQNGNSAGFWIQHRGWRSVCAQVLSIAGRNRGGLPGCSPMHDHAGVLMQCFDVRSGRPLPSNPTLEAPEDRGYVLIAEPPWYRGQRGPGGSDVAPEIAGPALVPGVA